LPPRSEAGNGATPPRANAESEGEGMSDFTDEKRNEHYREQFYAAMRAGDVDRVRAIGNEWGIDNTETIVAALVDHLRWRSFWQAQEKQESIAEVMYLLDKLIRIANHQKPTLRRYHWN
jgi:hypothetical protein